MNKKLLVVAFAVALSLGGWYYIDQRPVSKAISAEISFIDSDAAAVDCAAKGGFGAFMFALHANGGPAGQPQPVCIVKK